MVTLLDEMDKIHYDIRNSIKVMGEWGKNLLFKMMIYKRYNK